ncbi:hypothetical protein MVES1_000023 [Malassezia vespertilionis]|uniref:uncharacterized protein n=1 Tax=Malassezia vespertilionis TaxID=2020962 RepID=UPI0024B22A4C|nr:uncharacterized protein MVES1_000023 [Malassezia vespertilionis]WFD04700.1 hypothetical protein MVES1_000023 [Malassezia vespertilionis]
MQQKDSHGDAFGEPVPLFKKRSRCKRGTTVTGAALEPPAADQVTACEVKHGVDVDDLVAMRSMLRKPTGINLSCLNSGKQKCTEGKDWREEGEVSDTTNRFVRPDNFHREQGALGTENHM